MKIQHTIALIGVLLLHASNALASLSDTELFEAWRQELPNISETDFAKLREADPLVFSESVTTSQIFEVTVPSLRNILERFSDEKRASLELFANPYFSKSPWIFYFPRTVINVLNLEYDIPSVFFVRGYTRKDFGQYQKKIPKGSFFEMSALLVGQGRLVALYPFHISAHRTDPLFGFLTGNYDLYCFNVAEIKSSDGITFALENLVGRDQKYDKLKPVKAPLNASVKAIKFARIKPSDVEALLGHAWWNFKQTPIAAYSIPLYLDSPQKLRLPEKFVNETKTLALADYNRKGNK